MEEMENGSTVSTWLASETGPDWINQPTIFALLDFKEFVDNCILNTETEALVNNSLRSLALEMQ